MITTWPPLLKNLQSIRVGKPRIAGLISPVQASLKHLPKAYTFSCRRHRAKHELVGSPYGTHTSWEQINVVFCEATHTTTRPPDFLCRSTPVLGRKILK